MLSLLCIIIALRQNHSFKEIHHPKFHVTTNYYRPYDFGSFSLIASK